MANLTSKVTVAMLLSILDDLVEPQEPSPIKLFHLQPPQLRSQVARCSLDGQLLVLMVPAYMIVVVTTVEHAYTHSSLNKQIVGLDVQVITWEEVWGGHEPREAVYILTDFDRLPSWRLRFASEFYRKLRGIGRKVLNNPARVLSRPGLLRRLKRIGLNDYDAYRVEELRTPTRWPVFLRTDGDHHRPVSDLIYDVRSLEREIVRCVNDGYPFSTLLVIEYCAEEAIPGLFRKLSVFRLGPRLIGYTSVHDDQWVAKYGKPGIAPHRMYEEELRIVKTNPFAIIVAPAFEVSGIEYGRVDFGLVGGRVQIYEINTNPDINLFPRESPNPLRNVSVGEFRGQYVKALLDLKA